MPTRAPRSQELVEVKREDAGGERKRANLIFANRFQLAFRSSIDRYSSCNQTRSKPNIISYEATNKGYWTSTLRLLFRICVYLDLVYFVLISAVRRRVVTRLCRRKRRDNSTDLLSRLLFSSQSRFEVSASTEASRSSRSRASRGGSRTCVNSQQKLVLLGPGFRLNSVSSVLGKNYTVHYFLL